MRAIAAFMVFSAFGIVIRYLLGDIQPESEHAKGGHPDILPGTSVEELLAVEEDGQGR